MSRITQLVSAFLLVATVAHAQSQASGAQGTYHVVAGDVLDVIVWRNKDLSMQVTVRPDGWISYPLAGELRAADLTVPSIQNTLQESLAKYVTSPIVTIVVTRVANLKVSVLGKVRQPGRYDLQGPTTILDVLALASGPTEYADLDGIYILRRGSSPDHGYDKIPVRYSTTVSAGKSNTNISIAAGDIVIVP